MLGLGSKVGGSSILGYMELGSGSGVGPGSARGRHSSRGIGELAALCLGAS